MFPSTAWTASTASRDRTTNTPYVLNNRSRGRPGCCRWKPPTFLNACLCSA
ncbi:MAG: hypothetical protein HWN65_15705 [Candidatus Helarchaeota archaeon]|nr:hypothetical protein [Candidatus Helarchaeota archaeon]